MKKLVSLLLVLVLSAFLFPASLAEEEIVEDVMLDDEEMEESVTEEASAGADPSLSNQSVFTPSYGSAWESELQR